MAAEHTPAMIDAKALIGEQLARQHRARGRSALIVGLAATLVAHYPIIQHRAFKTLEGWSQGALMALGVAAAALVGINAALVFGKPLPRRRTLALIFAADLIAVAAFLIGTGKPANPAELPAAGWGCTAIGTVHAGVLTAVIFLFKDYLRHSPTAVLLTGGLLTATPLLMLHYHCPNPGLWHLLLQHGLVLIPALAMAFLFLAPPLRQDADDQK